MELMLVTATNVFLMEEARAGRLSAGAIGRARQTWANKANGFEIIEFQYDVETQRMLVLNDMSRLRFHGSAAGNLHVTNVAFHSWGSLAAVLRTRVFCHNDEFVRGMLHDAHRIVDMLGGPAPVRLALQELQLRVLAKMARVARGRAASRG
jgi:hypothetical protein